MKKYINDFFKVEQRGSKISTEITAGIITFLSMCYILFVNSGMLSMTGMDAQGVFTATAIAAVVATLVMGLAANYPIALAPGMGMNAMFTFTICFGLGYTYQEALAMVLISGIIALLISLTGARRAIINAIPNSLKKAIGAGIGLFIAYVGLLNSGVLEISSSSLPQLGDLSNPMVLVAIFGIIATAVLMLLNVRSALILGIVASAVLSIILHLCGVKVGISGGVSDGTLYIILAIVVAVALAVFLAKFKVKGSKILDSKWAALVGVLTLIVIVVVLNFTGVAKISSLNGIVSTPAKPAFGAFIDGFKSLKFSVDLLVVVFSLFFVDFFDTAGTLVSVGAKAGLIDENGELVDSQRALICDSTATIIGAIVGTSSTTSYVESMAGVEAGGRTGLTAVVVAIMFILSLFFGNLTAIVTSATTCAALVIVGVLMMQQIKEIEWEDLSIAIPAFITIILMPLSYSISNGIAAGFIFYVISKLASKKHKEISLVMWILCAFFVVYFISYAFVVYAA